MISVYPFLQYESSFMLILFRVTSFLSALPVMGGRTLPSQIKAGLALSVTFVLLPIVPLGSPPVSPPSTVSAWVIGLAGEAVIGWTIGLAVRLIFAAVDLGGEVMGIQMGFGIASVFDPVSNRPVPLIGQFYVLVATVVFFSIHADRPILQALVQSFTLIPPLTLSPAAPPVGPLVRLSGQLFILGMKIAVPVTLTLLLVNLALGILSRIVPQMNVWLMSFSITTGLGLFVIGATLSFFVALVQNQMGGLSETIGALLRAMNNRRSG